MIWLARIFGFLAICNLITMLVGYYSKAATTAPVVAGMDLQKLAGLASGMFVLCVVFGCVFWLFAHTEYMEEGQETARAKEAHTKRQTQYFSGEEIVDVEVISEEHGPLSNHEDWVGDWERSQKMRGRSDYALKRAFDKHDTDGW